MNLMISYYVPTRALHCAYQHVAATRRIQPTRNLVVPIPAIPGTGELPDVAEVAESAEESIHLASAFSARGFPAWSHADVPGGPERVLPAHGPDGAAPNST
jgi:hypothetical protein